MKKLILISAIVFISFANIFAQEVLKTNLRVKLINNVEFPEKLNCEFVVGHNCDFIAWNNIDHNILVAVQLLSFVETFDFHIWKIDTYKTTNDELIQMNYEEGKLYGIRMIDSNGFETLYIKSHNTKDYPQASK
jgi:hypothetical protein